MKTIATSLRVLFACVLACVLLAAGAVFLKPAPLAQASNVPSVDAIEMFWWGGRIGTVWTNNFNDNAGNNAPVPFPLQGAMAPPAVTSWEDVEVFMGWRQVLFRTPDGRLFELRTPATGAVGTTGAVTLVPMPDTMTAIPGVDNWNDVEIMAADMHVFARTLDGSQLFAWGNNVHGQLGLGHTNPVTVPTPVPPLTGLTSWTDVEIMLSINHTIARTPTGQLWGWGENHRGQLKQGPPLVALPGVNSFRAAPVNIPFPPIITTHDSSATNWNHVELFSLAATNFARTSNGNLFGWGQNDMGQLGQDSPTLNLPPQSVNHSPVAVRILPSTDMTSRNINNWANMDIVTHVGKNRTFARCQTSGHMFAWGQNDAGQAGVHPVGVNPAGGFFQIATPTIVPFPNIIPTRSGVNLWNNVELIPGAGHCFARTPCGRLFVWGNNASGQLGLGLDEVPVGSNSPFPREVSLSPSMIAAGMESWNDVTLVPGFVTNFALMRVPGVPLQKTVLAPEGTTIPSEITIELNFVRTQIILSDDPLRESRPVGEVPIIGDNGIVELELDMTTLETVGGTTTITALMNLRPLINAPNFFPGPGLFVWEVHEVPNSSSINGAPGPSTMEYDTARFQFRAYVDAHGVIILVVHEMVQNAQGEWVLGDGKPNAMDFTNILRSRAIDVNAVEFTKTVTCENDMANMNTPFTFTLNLTAHELTPFPTPLSIPAQRIAADNTVTNVTITSLPHEFTLLHGETFRIPEIYAGTTWNVTETAHPQFRAGVEVLVGGTVVHTYTNNAPNQSLSSGDRLVHDVGRNAADFTNVHAWDVPTGLVINNIPFVIPLAAAVMLALLLATRRRRFIEEMPMMH